MGPVAENFFRAQTMILCQWDKAQHRLDPDTMYEVMEKPKANQRETVKLDADTLRRFFPDYTPKQMETAILRMLEEAERERQRQKILRRSRDDAR